ncbi:hypothetical protein EXN66_Car016654 [Channa argus]|uniref:Uncharacterized protein n=1 Tax=Channa argus TaxID=215402 RepID=A0A6G1QFS0_CHAAH|nr:hypothetical protein EXN66_Car016654 [Channa argus]
MCALKVIDAADSGPAHTVTTQPVFSKMQWRHLVGKQQYFRFKVKPELHNK